MSAARVVERRGSREPPKRGVGGGAAPPGPNPFHIVCGTSAGAINAAALAVFADNFDAGVQNLLEVWENFRAFHVYRSDPFGVVAKSAAHWLSAMLRVQRSGTISLLDSAPLADMLRRSLDLGRIQENIDTGGIYAEW